MKPHEERVVIEKKELDAKRERLAVFGRSAVFQLLDKAERDRLRRQLEAMDLYSKILGERIEGFDP